MVLIKNPLSGGGSGGGEFDIANGIVKQYKAESGIIDPNTFVQFVDNSYATPAASDVSFTGDGLTRARAVAINDTQVFILLLSGSTDYAYGVVATFQNDNIVLGSNTQISSFTDYPMQGSVCKVDENKVVVAYGKGSTGTSCNLVVCTVSGDTITTGTITQCSGGYASWHFMLSRLEDNKFVLGYNSSSQTYWNNIVGTVSGTTITLGTSVSVYTSGTQGYFGVAATSSGSCINYGGSSYTTYFRRFSISGSTIAFSGEGSIYTNPSYLIQGGTRLSQNEFTSIGNGKVALIMRDSNYNGYYVVIITDTGYGLLSIGVSFISELLDNSSVYYNFGVASIDDDHIITGYGYNNKVYGTICRVSGIEANVLSTFDGGNCYSGGTAGFAIANCGNNVLLQKYRTSGKGGALYLGFNDYSTVEESSTKVDGLAVESCTTAVAGDVWVLGTSESQ